MVIRVLPGAETLTTTDHDNFSGSKFKTAPISNVKIRLLGKEFSIYGEQLEKTTRTVDFIGIEIKLKIHRSVSINQDNVFQHYYYLLWRFIQSSMSSGASSSHLCPTFSRFTRRLVIQSLLFSSLS